MRASRRKLAALRVWSAMCLVACSTSACSAGRAYGAGVWSDDEGREVGQEGPRDLDGDTAAHDSDAIENDDEPADGSASFETGEGLLSRDEITVDSVADLLRTFAYRGDGYRRANGRLFPSTVAPGKKIDMWVSAAAFDELTAVSPDRRGSEVQIAPGTLIVREVYEGDTLTAITAMVKLELGAFRLGGDFWYMIADPDGTIRQDADGRLIAGEREDCGSCHLRRSHDGFLFGTPDAYLP